MVFGGLIFEDRLDRWRLRGGENWDFLFENAGFFGGNFSEGVAEIFSVFKFDGAHCDSDWRDNVSGIKTAAHADFIDRVVDLGKTKNQHGK